MNYLSVENISKAYGERILFEDISFGINKDQKVAFMAILAGNPLQATHTAWLGICEGGQKHGDSWQWDETSYCAVWETFGMSCFDEKGNLFLWFPG